MLVAPKAAVMIAELCISGEGVSVTVAGAGGLVATFSGLGVAVGRFGVVAMMVGVTPSVDVAASIVAVSVTGRTAGGVWVETGRFSSSAARVRAAAVGKYSAGSGVDRPEASGFEHAARHNPAIKTPSTISVFLDLCLGAAIDLFIKAYKSR